MKPLIYSKKGAEYSNIGWFRDGKDINYYPSKKKLNTNTTAFYTLTFSLQFKCKINIFLSYTDENDSIYISNCYPYTYSDCQSYINKLTKNTK